MPVLALVHQVNLSSSKGLHVALQRNGITKTRPLRYLTGGITLISFPLSASHYQCAIEE